MSDKKTILIIEDDTAFKSAMRALLENEGYIIFDAEDGQSGLELALSQRPDLILLDNMMPIMSGPEFLSRIREMEWGKTAKIIMITETHDTGYLKTALTMGASDYIYKDDLDTDKILDVIKSKLS